MAAVNNATSTAYHNEAGEVDCRFPIVGSLETPKLEETNLAPSFEVDTKNTPFAITAIFTFVFILSSKIIVLN